MPNRLARSTVVAIGLGITLCASGCGSSGSSSTSDSGVAPNAQQHSAISLAITSHDDWATVRGSSAVIRGIATRGAHLEIDGKPVTVNVAGRWRKKVTLSMGSNSFSLDVTKPGSDEVAKTLNLTRRRTAAELAAWREQQRIKREQHLAQLRAERAQRAANFKASAITIPYKQLNKDAEEFSGKHVKYYGQIFQIQQGEYGGGIMLISVTNDGYGFWDDHIWVDYDGKVAGAEDDMVTVYGTITGSKSYETQIGGETYVPRMHARFIDE